MKFIIAITLSILLSASEVNLHQIKILETIMTKISLNSEVIIWSSSTNILSELKKRNHLKISNYCKDAKILILENNKNLSKECLDKSIFVLDYKLLSDIPKSFGALFWKKGRPNIVILEARIKAQNIRITQELEPYVEEKIW